MDHHGLVVNPTPRYMKLTNEGTIDISGGVKLESPLPTLKEAWDYRGDIDFLVHTPKGFPLRLQFAKIPVIIEKGYEGSSVAEGAYSLRITKKGISIMAENDLGLFYGIQTLRQLMESPAVEERSFLASRLVTRRFFLIVASWRAFMGHLGRTLCVCR